MKYKKSLLILILAIFLISVAGAYAADANDMTIANEETNQIDLSSNNEMPEDNLKINEDNSILMQSTDNKTASAESDCEILCAGEGTYSDLRSDIENGGFLTKSYYLYHDGDGETIEIDTKGMIINGNGAVIDMAGSNIRAFYITASNVTFKNLTIKNAYYDGNAAAIYFNSPGSIENCNFTDNTATHWAGAIMFFKGGNVTNCNFVNNHASIQGGAIRFAEKSSATNCSFINNTCDNWGGAIMFFDEGDAANCYFINNSAREGGAIYSYCNLAVTADRCIYKTSSDTTYHANILQPIE